MQENHEGREETDEGNEGQEDMRAVQLLVNMVSACGPPVAGAT